MRKIRRKVFETNSSSVHSISFTSGYVPKYDPWKEEREPGGLVADDETNRVPCHFGEFGREKATYTTKQDRLSYLLTMIAETEGYHLECVDDFYELPGYKLLDEMIAKECNCDGIEIADRMEIDIYEKKSYLSIDGFIDHQSCEYRNLQEFLDDQNISAKEFVFGEGVEITTGDDNVYDYN